MDEAFQRRDARAFVAYCAQDVVAVDEKQTFRNRTDFEKQMAGLILSIEKVRIARSEIRRFEVEGDIVRIDFTMHFTGEVKDAGSKTGQAKQILHHYDSEMNFHNDWKLVSGEWRIIRYATAGESGTIDGKPIGEERAKK